MASRRTLSYVILAAVLAGNGSLALATDATELTVFFKAGAKPTVSFVVDTHNPDTELEITGSYPNYTVTATNFGSRAALRLVQLGVNMNPKAVITNQGTESFDVLDLRTNTTQTLAPGAAAQPSSGSDGIIEVCMDFD